MRNYAILALLSLTAVGASAATPRWLEADSAAAIKARTVADFTYSMEEARQLINEKYNLNLTEAEVKQLADRHIIENKMIDGERRVFRKAINNFRLLNPKLNGNNPPRGAGAPAKRIANVDSVIAFYDGTNDAGGAQYIKYKFEIDVPYDDALEGDTLRVWMPVPVNTQRQSDIKIISTEPQRYIISQPWQSEHHTLYMSKPVVKGENTHFEAIVEYVAKGEYHNPADILRDMKPYDKNSEVYKKYTAFEGPHIVELKDLAKKIVGKEKNPFKQSELVYDYIIKRYPWAGAREYSTIECIPQYVVSEGHGDCGQVSLLYISLMRSLGVPARWESGWMLHAGEQNYHDWAEVYFEGIGWVPVDVSFGRYIKASDPRAVTFYSHGQDAHRLATNQTVCGNLYPPKKYVRSETVDLQAGEVESSRGNLFYPAWDHSLTILEKHPVTASTAERAKSAAMSVKGAIAPDKRQDVFEVEVVSTDGDKAVLKGKVSEPEHKTELERYLKRARVDANLDSVIVLSDTVWALPRISVANMRTVPGHDAEMASQALMGMPVRILEADDDWYRVQTPDGYIAWIIDNSLTLKTPAEMQAWRKAPRLVVTSIPQTLLYASATAKGPREVISDLVNGNIVEGSLDNEVNGRVKVTLPDGRTGWVNVADVTPIEQWASQPFDSDRILDQAYSIEGEPYLWGGTSTKSLDCSGLAKVSYLSNGIILMRDASQQALTGTRIEAKDWRTLQPGDLLFFGNGRTGRVTHVAIYDHDGNYVHSSARVRRNSVDPTSDNYLTTPFLHAVRINGNQGKTGIVQAINHLWYF